MGLSGQPCRTPDTDTRGYPCCPLIFTATVAEPNKPWIACSMLPCRPKLLYLTSGRQDYMFCLVILLPVP